MFDRELKKAIMIPPLCVMQALKNTQSLLKIVKFYKAPCAMERNIEDKERTTLQIRS